MTRTIRIAACFILMAAAFAAPAFAQTSVAVGRGEMDFDLSGAGKAKLWSFRVNREIARDFGVEVAATFAEPKQQFGKSALFAPEVQLQYQPTFGRFTPYLGAGLGFARERSDVIETDWTPTVVLSGGTRVSVFDRVGLFGELRIRGFEYDFVGTTADIQGGVVVRLGR